MESREPIGVLVKRLRAEQNLSQRKLAERSGIAREYINRLERTETKTVHLTTAEALAKGLGMSPNVFFQNYHTDATDDDLERTELVELPIMGSLPGDFGPIDQTTPERYTLVPRGEFGDMDTHRIYALKVRGDELSAMGIRDGEIVVIKPEEFASDGKLWIMRCGKRVAAIKAYANEEGTKKALCLHEPYKLQLVHVEPVDVLGRVILHGSEWEKM